MKKIDGYPHNGYPTDMDTGTGQIFIQRVGYTPYPTRPVDIPRYYYKFSTYSLLNCPITKSSTII